MVPVNYLAVLLCAIVAIVLGSLWYGPIFGKKWMSYTGMTDADMNAARTDPKIRNKMMMGYAITALGSLLMAFVLAHSIIFAGAYLGASGISAGLQGAIWSWIGFVAPATIGEVLWNRRPWGYWFLTAGFWLVTLIVMGIILGVWA